MHIRKHKLINLISIIAVVAMAGQGAAWDRCLTPQSERCLTPDTLRAMAFDERNIGSACSAVLAGMSDEEIMDLAQENLPAAGAKEGGVIFAAILRELRIRGWDHCFVLLRGEPGRLSALNGMNFIDVTSVSTNVAHPSRRDYELRIENKDRYVSGVWRLFGFFGIRKTERYQLGRLEGYLMNFVDNSLLNMLQHVREGTCLYLYKPEVLKQGKGQSGIKGFRVVAIDHGGGFKDDRHGLRKDVPVKVVLASRDSFGYGGGHGVGFRNSIRHSSVLRIITNTESTVCKTKHTFGSEEVIEPVSHFDLASRVDGVVLDAVFYETQPESECWADMVSREQARVSRLGDLRRKLSDLSKVNDLITEILAGV